MSLRAYCLIIAALAGVAGIGTLIAALVHDMRYVTVVRTEYQAPRPPEDDFLKDDRLEDKPSKFDPELVGRTTLDGWLINHSAAVIRLDCPEIKPDREADLLTLYPSYAAAYAAIRQSKQPRGVLPSVNMLDGKATQFDNGLYAALDQAYYRGLDGKLLGHVELVRRLFDKLGKNGEAAAFLAAGLELAGVQVDATDVAAKQRLLAAFEANELLSKPIGFYTWNDTLKKCFRFLRFFQRQFGPMELHTPQALARALAEDKELRARYQEAMTFYARLTNPYICLSVADMLDMKAGDVDEFAKRCAAKKVKRPAVALFPPSTSRETVLFERLFPTGLPQSASLMRELVRRIRSGEIDLKPNAESGWYEHQVYALETFLLPERGEERDRLLLTRNYKKRMLEAFKAMITKRRETHLRQSMHAASEAMRRPTIVRPQLHLEPCPSYYLRTARAYAFLANFLEAAVGAEALGKLHGLTRDGERKPDLHSELKSIRDLFYGFYLISADDIGLKPALLKDEPVKVDQCYGRALSWLSTAFDDPDMAADTRISVPIYVDAQRGVTRLWTTLGVRFVKLDASYARAPSIKLPPEELKKLEDNKQGRPRFDEDIDPRTAGEWQVVREHTLASSHYLIPVDEFAEVELKGMRTLTREELRAVCDREKTKPAILAALGQSDGGGEPEEQGAGLAIPWRWVTPLGLFAFTGLCLVLSRVFRNM